jgi:hypothetical protein
MSYLHGKNDKRGSILSIPVAPVVVVVVVALAAERTAGSARTRTAGKLSGYRS